MNADLAPMEQSLVFLADNTTDGIVIVSAQLRCLYANRRIADLLGWTQEEILAVPALDLIEESMRRTVGERFQARLAGGPVGKGIEVLLRHRDGTLIPALMSAVVAPWRGRSAGFVIIRDIRELKRSEALLREEQELTERLRLEVSERIRAEEALRRSERRFRDLVDSSGGYVWEADVEARITYLSERVRDILGYAPEELLGRTPFALMPPEEAQRLTRYYRDLVARKEGYQELEQRAITRSGREIWLRATAVPVLADDGSLLGYRGTATEITVARRAQEALYRRDAILEALSYATERLLKASRWQDCATEVLRCLAHATDVHRVGLFENEPGASDVVSARLAFHWLDPARGPADLIRSLNFPSERSETQDWLGRFRSGQPLCIPLLSYPSILREYLFGRGIRSVAAVPVLVQDDWWGTITLVDYVHEREWSNLEIQALTLAGRIIGGVIERQRVEDALRVRDSILEAVNFAALLDLKYWEESLAEIMERLGQATGCDRVNLYSVREGETDETGLTLKDEWCDPTSPFSFEVPRIEEIPAALVESAGWLAALRKGRPQVYPGSEVSDELRKAIDLRGIRCALFVPILPGRSLWGLLAFIDHGRERAWSSTEVDALAAAGNILGTLILRQGMEAALRESEEKYRGMIEGAAQPITMVDRSGRFLLANAAAGEELGVSPQSIVGRSMWECFPAAQADRHMEGIRLAIDTGEPVVRRGVSTARGRDRWYEGKSMPLRGPDGAFDRALVFVTDVTESMEAESKILAYQEHLRSLNAELTRTEERERRRLAGQLHDGIGQTLAMAKIKLAAIQESCGTRRVSDALDEVHSLIDQTVQEARALTFELSPPLLDELGLVPALEWLVERFRGQYGIEAVFRQEGTGPLLDPDLRAQLFQAARELLANVVKHAHARQVRITLRRQSGLVTLEAADDGEGFVPAILSAPGVPVGFGLFNIRERFEQIGGDMKVDSAPGKGTVIVLSVGLDEAGRAAKRL